LVRERNWKRHLKYVEEELGPEGIEESTKHNNLEDLIDQMNK